MGKGEKEMKLPDTISICGIPFSVKESNDLYSPNGVCNGEIEHSKALIKINSNIAEVLKMPTLYHEWVHGALILLGHDELCDNEQFVQSMAIAIYHTFQIRGDYTP